MHWPDIRLPFVQTSPAIASYEAALLYPGLCLFEATNLSVGRGTGLSFQAIAAPWLKAVEIVQAFNACDLPGVRLEATAVQPFLAPYTGVDCSAVRLQITDSRALRPVEAGLRLLGMVIALHRQHFQWTRYPTAANPTGEGHFERLIGMMSIREALDENPPDLAERVKAWTTAPGWQERVRNALIYA